MLKLYLISLTKDFNYFLKIFSCVKSHTNLFSNTEILRNPSFYFFVSIKNIILGKSNT